MGYGAEFINVFDVPVDQRLIPGEASVTDRERNATNFFLMCAALMRAPSRGGYIYFPPGRWVIGRPRPELMASGTEQISDLVVPAGVTLMFAPGAVLVPASYTEAEVMANPDKTWLRRVPEGLAQSDHLKVRIEVQGGLIAPHTQVFDPFMDPLDTEMPQIEAGRILFQRDTVREVYPEWWGAVPMVNEQPGTPAQVRRTTAALQAALDAGFNHRLYYSASSVPLLDDRGRLVRDRGGNVVYQKDELGNPLLRYALTGRRPSIPVVLSSDYAIDRPLRIGATVNQAKAITDPYELPNNTDGLVLRGECGPATRSFGAAMIKAAPGFRAPTLADRRPAGAASPTELSTTTEVASMLVMRTLTGVTMENLVLDADEVAPRCVTASVLGATQSHSNGFVGCEFRNAALELVRIGGETPPITDDGAHDENRTIDVQNIFFSGGLDLSGLRFTRCRFDTGSDAGRIQGTLARLGNMRDAMRDPSADPLTRALFNALYTKVENDAKVWRVGVVFRAGQSLGVEFHGCSFRGCASPMFLALGGRLSFQRCSFRTEEMPTNTNGLSAVLEPRDVDQPELRRWNGTDLYLAAPFTEYLPPDPVNGRRVVQTEFITTLLARNIESRSRQFLTSYPPTAGLTARSPKGSASVLLMHVRHRSPVERDKRPAIYWGGPRENNVLTLVGCVFRRGEASEGGVYVAAPGTTSLGGVMNAPVVDLGARRADGLGGRAEVLHTNPELTLQSYMRLARR